MHIEPITKKGFPDWLDFRRRLYPVSSEQIEREEINTCFNSDDWFCWFVVNADGEKIGLIELSLRSIVDGCMSSPVPYLEGLYLVESERNKGLGTEIVDWLISWCRDQGHSEFATDTELWNTEAQRFYEKRGFKEIDKVVEYRLEIDSA